MDRQTVKSNLRDSVRSAYASLRQAERDCGTLGIRQGDGTLVRDLRRMQATCLAVLALLDQLSEFPPDKTEEDQMELPF